MAEYIDREALEKAMTIAAANEKDKGGMTNAADRCGKACGSTKQIFGSTTERRWKVRDKNEQR